MSEKEPDVEARLDFLVQEAPGFLKDVQWLAQRHKYLRRKYPGEWVYIRNRRVIAHGPDHEKLADTVKDPGSIVRWYIDPPGTKRIQTIAA